MAFDEGFHFGVTKLYAEHMSPFWTAQPAGADTYGAIFRDPSYMFHVIMSVPYNIIALFTSNLATQVISLRIINIGLFLSALIIYRRLLIEMKASKALANVTLFVFVMIPVVPILAGQINYDNLFIALCGLTMLWVVKLCGGLKKNRKIDTELLFMITVLGLFGVLVKFAYVPFIVCSALIVTAYLLKIYKFNVKTIARDIASGIRGMDQAKRWALVSLFVILGILAFERYGVNYIRYGALAPDCGKVLSVEQCKKFGPWGRDYNLAAQKNFDTKSATQYIQQDWLYGMWFRLFFAVSGPDIGYQTKRPYLPPSYTFIALAVIAVFAGVVFAVRLFKLYGYRIVIPFVLCMFYVSLLLLNNFGAYERTGRPVAINGRYLLPVLIPLIAIGGMAVSELFGRRQSLKIGLLGILTLGFIWGGGALTFILRSDSAWYWNNSVVKEINATIRDNSARYVPGNNKPY
jgi:hypothetical protein